MEKQRTVILHGFSPEEALAAMRALKALAPEAAFATTTETNLGWKLKDLLEHVAEEHSQYGEMAKNKKE